jgi:hypothetical protein
VPIYIPSVPGINELDTTAAAYNKLLLDLLKGDDVTPDGRAIALAVRATGAEISAAILRSGMVAGPK